jgi:hypothetical protein
LLAGLVACTVPALFLGGGDVVGLPDIGFLLMPFIPLAVVAPRLSFAGAAILLALLVAGTVLTQVGVYTSEGSTASIALLLYPILFVVGVVFGAWIDTAVRDVAAYRRRDGTRRPPRSP